MFESTEGIANFLNLNQEVKSTQFRKLTLLSKSFSLWKQVFDSKKDLGLSDSEGEEDGEDEGQSKKNGKLEGLPEDEEYQEET